MTFALKAKLGRGFPFSVFLLFIGGGIEEGGGGWRAVSLSELNLAR